MAAINNNINALRDIVTDIFSPTLKDWTRFEDMVSKHPILGPLMMNTHPNEKAVTKKKSTPKDKNKPKRAPTAYNNYMKESLPGLVATTRGEGFGGKEAIQEAVKRLGHNWKLLSTDEKSFYTSTKNTSSVGDTCVDDMDELD
jgi:hypothetical protein